MNLDKLQINATIRSGWQALDLGFLMARAWWRPLYLASLLSLLPLALALLVVFSGSPLWALAIVWWLKPFWERLPLFIASRRLFDEESGVWSSMKSLPLKDILPWLLWRRFSVQRAFDNPVTVLEELKGGLRRQRLRILHGKYSDVALANQFVCFCFELLVCFGIIVMLDFFTPDTLDLRIYDRFNDLTLLGEWIYALAGIAAITLVMPFHSMAGFALYLNRRIELEAWDIEISFRSLAERKRQQDTSPAGLVAALLLGISIALATPGAADAAADHDRESATVLIGEVLDGEDFGQQRTVRKWRFKDWSEEVDEDTFPEWLIEFLEWWEANVDWSTDFTGFATWLKIMLVALFVGLLVYLLYRFRGPLSRLGPAPARQAAPEVLFGLDVTPQSLPPDVPAEVMRLWAEGGYREALSLLYRASLSRLIDKYELAFRASHTEAECAALVRARGIDSLSDYFWQLTSVWRRLAYGHQLPAAEMVRSLCDGWKTELSREAE
ncbi:MAG: DUF4129 domain-containing protein [Gammaproteobacteria bacterium]|nr:DUF4129 domain-containing protein [Gammaproteobacteria bacterium]